MPAKCDQCGKPSYVMYVKLNPGIICDECEDADRKSKGVHDVWGTIQNNNRQGHYHHTKIAQIKPPA